MSVIATVLTDGKSLRLRIDACTVSPDRECKPPLKELLQEFHIASYVTPSDLSKEFLWTSLKKEL
jgi:hypothetical protein